MKINKPVKKFGLVKPKPSSNPLFTEEDEDIQNKKTMNENLLADSIRQKSKAKIQTRLKEALSEDPSIFDYDEVLPTINNNRKQALARKKAQNSSTDSKYIHTLLAKAEQRKWEYERVREIQILKQIEAEKEIYGEKPQYTTSKYKKHLQERQKWEEEQDKLALQDNDVTKESDMSNFYYKSFSNVIGDRLTDSDPLTIEEQKKTEKKEKEIKLKEEAKEKEKENEQQLDKLNKEKLDNDKGEQDNIEGNENENDEINDKPIVLTREEKIEQARIRYFERRAKRLENKNNNQ